MDSVQGANMKQQHLLIELARTERAIAEALQALEEQKQIIEDLKSQGPDTILEEKQRLEAMRRAQQRRVVRRDAHSGRFYDESSSKDHIGN